uniref:Uncharacterized protein n=1 Tax=Amazona collaria TaxID=241587 RepID=A0A8B9FXA1_9PSIT
MFLSCQEQLRLYRTWPISQAHRSSATLKKEKNKITSQETARKKN